jgi:hypothetical protein
MAVMFLLWRSLTGTTAVMFLLWQAALVAVGVRQAVVAVVAIKSPKSPFLFISKNFFSAFQKIEVPMDNIYVDNRRTGIKWP